jgi:hypothetical protein
MDSMAHELEELAPTIARPFDDDDDDLDVTPEDGDLEDIDVSEEEEAVSFGDNVGGHVLGSCKACRTNTMQAVIDRAGDAVIRSQCNVCGSEHAYRAPKREKARVTKRPPRKKAADSDPAQIWATSKAKMGDKDPLPYAITNPYQVGDAINHPKFGLCFVLEICSPTKISVALEGETKRLVCNLP